MQIQMVYELNHTYMIINAEEAAKADDFRYRMLRANNIRGVLPFEIRHIDNKDKLFVDVTGKESLYTSINYREANRDELRRLFEAIYVISSAMSKYLIDEPDIMMSPEMVFRDVKTGEYEFICIPRENISSENEGMKSLLRFIMMHLDNKDEKLVEAVYAMNDLYETGIPKFSVAYDMFAEKVKEEAIPDIVEVPVEEVLVERKKKRKPYIPTFWEIAAAAMCLFGLVLIGYNMYLSMIVT